MSTSAIKLKDGLAHNLVLARKARGMTQAELAEAAGISRATVTQIEREDVDPKLSTIADLANALDLTPAWLLMSKQDLKILSQMATSKVLPELTETIPEAAVEKMQALVESGRQKNVFRALSAAKDSLQDAVRDKLSGEDSAAGIGSAVSAIGTSLLPGTGTVIASIWDRYRSGEDPDLDEEEIENLDEESSPEDEANQDHS